MNDLEKKSIECIKNMLIEETTYQVARNVVLDYITNLQQENEKLNKENEKWWAIIKDYEMDLHDLWNKNNDLEQENEKLKELDENYPIEEELAEAYRREEDYKSRCDKARIYIKKHLESWETEDIRNIRMLDDEFDVEVLLNILNGRSDE